MKNCNMAPYCEKVTEMVTKMKNTDIRCDLGMNVELVDKSGDGCGNKQWKTQKNCALSLFDLVIIGGVALCVMAIGASLSKKKCKDCGKDCD